MGEKKVKKLLSVVFILGLTSSLLANTTFAKDNNELSDVDQLLEQSGFDSETLVGMSYKDKKDIADAIRKDPDSVEISNTILNVDNLSTFEYFTNTEENELVKDGFNDDEIKEIKRKLNFIDSLSEGEMEKQYSLSSSEYKMIKQSLKKNPNYKPKKDFGEKKVTTSGNIATTKMSFSMSKVNKSTTTAPSYNMTVTYNWLSPYFMDIFSDNIGVSWGGGLNSKNISSTANYYSGNWYTGKYSTFKYNTSWSKQETPNKGIVFSTPQSRAVATQQNKTGTIKFTLYQTKFKGYDTKVLAQFAHKTLAVNNITISGSPSITIGTGFDKSAQKSSTIRY